MWPCTMIKMWHLSWILLYRVYVLIEHWSGVLLYVKTAGRLAAKILRAFQFEGMGWPTGTLFMKGTFKLCTLLSCHCEWEKDKQSVIEAKPRKRASKRLEQWRAAFRMGSWKPEALWQGWQVDTCCCRSQQQEKPSGYYTELARLLESSWGRLEAPQRKD